MEDRVTRGMALGNAAVLGHLLLTLVEQELVPRKIVFDFLHAAELDLLKANTEVSAAGAGHVIYLRGVFDKATRHLE